MTLEIDDLGVCGIVVDDWAIEKSFKPKTITTDYSSWIVYISRRAVPANTPITDTYYWKPLTRLQSQLAFNYETFKEEVNAKLNSMALQIETFLRSVAGGTALTDVFGNSELIGINQKVLTAAINKIWDKIEDMTGEVLQGFSMVVTPEYYIGETGADIHIAANTVDTNGIFEYIALYGNGVLIAEADNVDFFEYDFHINETTVIKCVAKILGVEYNKQDIINHYSSFLLGSGDSYENLMDANNRFLPQYVIPITNGMRGAYDVNVAEGKRIIIVVGDTLSEGFIRADLNGVEIQFTESTCTDADGKVYKVFTSEPWSAGDYNIDING